MYSMSLHLPQFQMVSRGHPSLSLCSEISKFTHKVYTYKATMQEAAQKN
jgi:hypothetical protein